MKIREIKVNEVRSSCFQCCHHVIQQLCCFLSSLELSGLTHAIRIALECG